MRIKLTNSKYRQHIKSLCQQNNIQIKICDNGFYRSRQQRKVWIPHIRSFRSYIKSLHQIGHILTFNKSDNILECEANAWWWVIELFKKEYHTIDVRLSLHIRECLKEYLRMYFGRKNLRAPSPKHIFWDLLRMKNGN